MGLQLAEEYCIGALGLDVVSVGGGEAVAERSVLSRAVGRYIGYLGVPALSWGMENVVAVLYPVEDDEGEEAAHTDLEAMRRRLSEELGDLGCSLGIGRVYRGLRGVPKAFREAREALESAKSYPSVKVTAAAAKALAGEAADGE